MFDGSLSTSFVRRTKSRRLPDMSSTTFFQSAIEYALHVTEAHFEDWTLANSESSKNENENDNDNATMNAGENANENAGENAADADDAFFDEWFEEAWRDVEARPIERIFSDGPFGF
jgi:hypothetical protein